MLALLYTFSLGLRFGRTGLGPASPRGVGGQQAHEAAGSSEQRADRRNMEMLTSCLCCKNKLAGFKPWLSWTLLL